MKKILFLLISLYSFSFSAVYDATNSGFLPSLVVNPYNDLDYYLRDKYSSSSYCYGTSKIFDEYWSISYGSTYNDLIGTYQWFSDLGACTYNGNPGYILYTDKYNYSTTPPTCDSGQVIYDGACVEINTLCDTGFVSSSSDKDSVGNTVGICSSCRDISSDVASQAPDGWISFVNIYNTEYECAKKAQDEYIGRYTFQIYQTDNCTYNICYIDTFNYNGCEDAQNYKDLTISGYIMKGIVNLEESCRSYVDTVNYLNYYVERVYPDCEYDTSMYCFLKPSLDNPDEGVPPPDENSTNPDGTIKLDSNNSVVPELNTSTFSGYDLNTTTQTNNLLTSLSADMKRFIDMYRADDDYWRKENDKKFKERTDNDNANTNKMLLKLSTVSGTISSQFASLDSRIDTLIGDTTDVSSEVLGDISTLGDSLSDFNFTGGDTNISSSLTSTDIVDNLEGAYEGFGDKAINSITDMINAVDFGILDIFSVSDRDFQDYVISDIYISSDVKIGGKLMDATFLNGLDWSYAKLALLLATLLASARYIFERVA